MMTEHSNRRSQPAYMLTTREQPICLPHERLTQKTLDSLIASNIISARGPEMTLASSVEILVQLGF